jgi:hypothetical protein
MSIPLLEDYQLEKDFAAENKITVRTSKRYRDQGLAWLRFAGRVWIHLPGARDWLAKRTTSAATKKSAAKVRCFAMKAAP